MCHLATLKSASRVTRRRAVPKLALATAIATDHGQVVGAVHPRVEVTRAARVEDEVGRVSARTNKVT